jgi:hypothetical protein
MPPGRRTSSELETVAAEGEIRPSSSIGSAARVPVRPDTKVDGVDTVCLGQRDGEVGDRRGIFSAIAAEDMQLVEVEGDHFLLSPGTTRRAVADLIVASAQEHVA